MEIFAASRLETTERAKFVGIVSALEPLAIQHKYDDKELNSLIKSFQLQLQESNLTLQLKNSLQGRIGQLKRESVSQAIKRLTEESLPRDSQSADIINDAYNLRSKILHEGSTDADLQLKSREVEEIIRKIFKYKISKYINNQQNKYDHKKI